MSELTMADRICADGARFETAEAMAGLIERFVHLVSGAMVIKVDNVAKYSFQQKSAEIRETMRSVSGLRLPSEFVFCEYEIGSVVSLEGSAKCCGSLLWTGGPEWWDILCGGKSYAPVPEHSVELVCGVQFFEFGDGSFWLVPSYQIAAVDEHGSALGFQSACDAKWVGAIDSVDPNGLEAIFRGFIPAPLAIAFVNCRNVQRVEHVPRPKLSKRCEAAYGRPAVKYYTLEIEPMKRVLEDEGHVSENGLPKALHICRGHFKDYREHGLFGRQKGLYWWSNHVRGSAERGVVVKDYSVKAPEPTS